MLREGEHTKKGFAGRTTQFQELTNLGLPEWGGIDLSSELLFAKVSNLESLNAKILRLRETFSKPVLKARDMCCLQKGLSLHWKSAVPTI